MMVDENFDRDMIKEKRDMDKKIIEYLDTHITDRVALESKVRALEFHRAVLDLIDRAKEDGIFDVSTTLTAEELFIMLELGLLSSKQEKKAESK